MFYYLFRATCIRNNIEVIFVCFVYNDVIHDTTRIISEHAQGSCIVIQFFDICNNERFYESDTILSSDLCDGIRY